MPDQSCPSAAEAQPFASDQTTFAIAIADWRIGVSLLRRTGIHGNRLRLTDQMRAEVSADPGSHSRTRHLIGRAAPSGPAVFHTSVTHSAITIMTAL